MPYGQIFKERENALCNQDKDLSLKRLSLRVAELEKALCNQDKLLRRVFRENKK
jgi:hypothetical protein